MEEQKNKEQSEITTPLPSIPLRMQEEVNRHFNRHRIPSVIGENGTN
jgi:hypothetical protein